MSDRDFVIKQNDKDVLLTFVDPTADEIEESKKVYSRKVAFLLRNKQEDALLTRNRLEEYLRKVDVWSDADEDKIKSLQDEILELYRELKRGDKKLSEGRQIAIKMTELRREIIKINRKRQLFDEATIESMAEEDQKDYLIFACTRHQDGERYWGSMEDVKDAKLSDAYMEANRRALENLYDISTKFEHSLPENKWLKKHGFIDEDLNYIDRKTHEQVDRDGQPLSQRDNEKREIMESLLMDIVEDKPYIDDETGEPVIITKEVSEEPEAEVTKPKPKMKPVTAKAE